MDNINIIEQGETKFVEYKREYTNSLLKTISAYANYHDGKIFIGISNNGSVFGVNNARELCLSIENAINDNIIPRPYFELYIKKLSKKPVIIIKVYKGDFTPYYYKNKAYKRSDTSTVETDRQELNRLILKGQNFSCEEMESKNQELYFNYLENKFRIQKRISSLNFDMLKSLELVNKEKYNNAAALLSDNNQMEYSTVILIKYSKDLTNISDKVLLKNISIIKQFDECINFYRKHISVSEIINGPYRETIEEIPLVAYREAVANAIIHRDYMAKGDIKVEFFEDRIEIISPGGLPLGISEEEYIEGRLSVMRNRIIADIFLRLGIIEKLATGIRRIKEHYSKSSTFPKFDVKQNSIKVVLPKIISKCIKEDTNAYYGRLNNHEKKIIDYIKKHGEITRKTAEDILKKGKTQTYKILKDLIIKNYILKTGKSKNTEYILK